MNQVSEVRRLMVIMGLAFTPLAASAQSPVYGQVFEFAKSWQGTQASADDLLILLHNIHGTPTPSPTPWLTWTPVPTDTPGIPSDQMAWLRVQVNGPNGLPATGIYVTSSRSQGLVVQTDTQGIALVPVLAFVPTLSKDVTQVFWIFAYNQLNQPTLTCAATITVSSLPPQQISNGPVLQLNLGHDTVLQTIIDYLCRNPETLEDVIKDKIKEMVDKVGLEFETETCIADFLEINPLILTVDEQYEAVWNLQQTLQCFTQNLPTHLTTPMLMDAGDIFPNPFGDLIGATVVNWQIYNISFQTATAYALPPGIVELTPDPHLYLGHYLHVPLLAMQPGETVLKGHQLTCNINFTVTLTFNYPCPEDAPSAPELSFTFGSTIQNVFTRPLTVRVITPTPTPSETPTETPESGSDSACGFWLIENHFDNNTEYPESIIFNFDHSCACQDGYSCNWGQSGNSVWWSYGCGNTYYGTLSGISMNGFVTENCHFGGLSGTFNATKLGDCSFKQQ